jgi:hypothetical protein
MKLDKTGKKNPVRGCVMHSFKTQLGRSTQVWNRGGFMKK